MRYQIWNKTDDIFTPSGEQFTPGQWVARYRWAGLPGAKMVITSGLINGGVAMEFEQMKRQYVRMGAEITDGMTDEEVLAAMEAFEDNQAHSDVPTTEERTAAALEYLALNSLPDETV